MKTALVILNWNTRELLSQFLPPLLHSVEGMDAGVIVADNASTDSSTQLLREDFPQVEVLELDCNYGFTGGYNRALEKVDAEYIVLINSDIEVSDGWLEPLLEWMDSHPQCGACAPKILSLKDRERFEYAGAAGGFVDLLGLPYCRGRVLSYTETDKGQYDTPCRVLWGSGACLMVRHDIWKEMGGLDDRFFAHMEEIDLCWRMQLSGYEVWSVPSSKVWHLGGGTLSNGSVWKLELNFRNSLLMLQNCLPGTIGAFGASVVLGLRMVMDCGIALGYLLKGRKDAAKAVLRAHRSFKSLRRRRGIFGKKAGDGINGIRGSYVRAADVRGYTGLVIFKYIRTKFSHS